MARSNAVVLVAAMSGGVLLTACGSGGPEAASTVTVTTTATTTVTETVEPQPPKPKVSETEETESGGSSEATVVAIGEEVELPSATITITDVEQVESLGEGLIEPDEGETLWLVSMEWTNTSDAAVSKVCHGPDVVDMEVYDTQDREMLDSNDSGFIEGNDCSNGLLTGQSGEWYEAFLGVEGVEIGYAGFFEGYDTPPTAVILNDDVELSLSD